MPYQKYETVIGLEVHVQLGTQSKAFCRDSTVFGGAPNTHVSAISLGHPGTLPRLNKQQVSYAARLGLALGCTINLRNAFDRKNYFYADLPKGYQITQDKAPVCLGGSLRIQTGDVEKEVRIHHIHMEEDAGKSLHNDDPLHSYIDLNRAGVPLLEIVTEPDLRSAEEVDVFMTTMRQLVRYLGVSDGNMEEGSMRCDCNVSVRLKGAEKYGQRCEIKNLNSMKFARRAIEYEVRRQIDLLEAGGKVEQQTLNFNPDTGVTTPLRDKEDAHDYRYFPEPDLAPMHLTTEWVEKVRKELPMLPWQVETLLQTQYELPEYDAKLLSADKATADYFLAMASQCPYYKAVANLIINKILPAVSDISEFPVPGKALAEMLELIEKGSISNTAAYQKLFPALLENPAASPISLSESLGLLQNSDTDTLAQWVEEVVAANPDKVKAYKQGKKGLLGFFMGELMKKSKGKADPKRSNELMVQALEK